MREIQKVAVARIFTDLITADRIVDTGEMEFWHYLSDKYSLDHKVRAKAHSLTLAEAVKTICTKDNRDLRQSILMDCRQMSVSDGYCAHSEAMLIMMLNCLLSSRGGLDADIYSILRANFNIDIATTLYIEDEYNPAANKIIIDNYRTLYKELQLAGFHLIYIPKVIDHYRNTKPALFKDILSFLAPTLTPSFVEKAYRSILGMSTGYFTKDILCNKCGMNGLRNTGPSLLLKISHSYVDNTQYANYLRIGMDPQILTRIQILLDDLLGMLSGDLTVVSTSEERNNQFHFHGFYKQLLDIVLVKRDIRSPIIINPYKEEIFFPGIDTNAMGLHRRERALYALFLCRGRHGLNFSTPRSAHAFEQYKELMATIQKQYAAIYEMFGGNGESAPDLTQPEIRRPIVSRLRTSIGKLNGLYNPQDYSITKQADGSYAVHIEPELVSLVELDSKELVPLHESKMYKVFRSYLREAED